MSQRRFEFDDPSNKPPSLQMSGPYLNNSTLITITTTTTNLNEIAWNLDPSDIDSFILRIKCLYLLGKIPGNGLYEMHEIMEQIFEFYSSISNENNPLLLEESSIVVEVGQTYTRPEFPIVED